MNNIAIDNADRIGVLIFRYFRNEISAKDQKELDIWRKASPQNENAFLDSIDPDKLQARLSRIYETKEAAYLKIKKERPFKKIRRGIFMLKQATRVAAGVLVIIIGYLLFQNMFIKRSGSKFLGAVLISSNGVAEDMDDFHRGNLAAKAGISFEDGKNGELVYIVGVNKEKPKKDYFGLTASFKEALPLKLPNGVQILLNTRSTIKYPANFTNDSIHLFIEGEAWINIPQQSSQVYQIIANGITIQTAGAELNVSAYHKDSLVATILKGSAVIANPSTVPHERDQPSTITAGEQEILTKNSMTINSSTDSLKVLAWKRKLFSSFQ